MQTFANCICRSICPARGMIQFGHWKWIRLEVHLQEGQYLHWRAGVTQQQHSAKPDSGPGCCALPTRHADGEKEDREKLCKMCRNEGRRAQSIRPSAFPRDFHKEQIGAGRERERESESEWCEYFYIL